MFEGRRRVSTLLHSPSLCTRVEQDIEQERSDGSVQTMNRIFGMLGLKLSVARIARDTDA